MIQSQRKRTISEIEETNIIYNRQNRINRSEFLKKAKNIIYKNYPGITLEGEKHYGRPPNEIISFKSRPDCIGRTCLLGMRVHSKNSSFFLINPQKHTISVRCFKCQGEKQISENDEVLKEIMPLVVVSEKESKKTKTTNIRKLDDTEGIEIVKFEHHVLHVDFDTVMEFYDLNQFVLVAASKAKKQPTFSGWCDRTYAQNEKINLKYNNIAIVCGGQNQSNIFVLDIDVSDEGLSTLQKICSLHKYKYDDATCAVLTPSGGVHLYFQHEEGLTNSVKMQTESGKKIGWDIRAARGCVIAPPSIYEGSGEYRFLCMKKPQKCPDFLLKYFKDV